MNPVQRIADVLRLQHLFALADTPSQRRYEVSCLGRVFQTLQTVPEKLIQQIRTIMRRVFSAAALLIR